MSNIPQVAKSMQKVLNEEARQAGYVTGFVQRESKLTASLFVQILTFGFLSNPQATLEELCQTAAALGLKITPQGLDDRFSEAAGDLLKRILLLAIKELIQADEVAVELLQRFAGGVRLYDSTTIFLALELASHWQGAGGSKGINAALKLDVCWNFNNGQIVGLSLLNGREHEAGSQLHRQQLPALSLRINDLGYFDLAQYRKAADEGGYWLSQIKAHTLIYDLAGEYINLAKLLKKRCHAELEIDILLGKSEQLPCRLLAQRISKKVARKRRRDLRAEARREGKAVSKKRLALADWTIYCTNVPADMLTLKEAMVLARVRWQIELLFKLWKSHGLIDESRSSKQWRQLCEVYAKMLAMIIQHWILLVSCWQYADRSLFKAVKTIQKLAFHMAGVFRSLPALCQDIEMIARCLAFGCRINKSKAKPATHQLLTNTLA